MQTRMFRQLQIKREWGSSVLFAKYTTDFDCRDETKWWWVVKDDPIDISTLDKKRRYRINKGIKNFTVRRISPKAYAEEIYSVYLTAYGKYKNVDRPMDKNEFIKNCTAHEEITTIEYYGAFDNESRELSGYSYNDVYNDYALLTTMKFNPECLSQEVSAALVYTMLCDYLNTQNKKYVIDGERSINHITNFQNYLMNVFGFRYAYCHLHIEYKFCIGIAIRVIYPFRSIVKRFSSNTILHSVSSLLDLEEIHRCFKA